MRIDELIRRNPSVDDSTRARLQSVSDMEGRTISGLSISERFRASRWVPCKAASLTPKAPGGKRASIS